MTIQEAIKSGKPFRRKAQRKTHAWMFIEKDYDKKKAFGIFGTDGKKKKGWHAGIFDPLDILATDWEVKP